MSETTIACGFARGTARVWRTISSRPSDRGADADFVLVDPRGLWVVEDRDIILKAGWTPYNGGNCKGGVAATYARGRLVVENDSPLDDRTGRFVPGIGAS